MMKLVFSFLMISGLLIASAQQNDQFENWTVVTESWQANPFPPVAAGSKDYDSLHFWSSSDDLMREQTVANGVGFALSFIDQTIAEVAGNGGGSAAEMTTVDCQVCTQIDPTFDKIPGFLSYKGLYTQGFLPESFSFSYQSNIVSGDKGAVLIILTGNGAANDTLGFALAEIDQTQSGWTDLTAVFNYDMTGTADSIHIFAASSGEAIASNLDPTWPAAQIGTTLTIDNITYNQPTPGVASPIGFVIASDVANNGNGLDLEAQWGVGIDETTISTYRMIVVKEANAATFDLTAAEAATDYVDVTPNGSAYTRVFAAMSNDVDGDRITLNTPYVVFILSVADGTNATTNSLSPGSNTVTLTIPSADVATNPFASDIGNQGNGFDLNLQWTQGTDETTISEYRLYCVKSANAASFDLAAAEAVPATAYVVESPIGGPYSRPFDNVVTDVDGDAIVEGVAYKLFILSVADGVNAATNTLSVESNEVTLAQVASVLENANVSAKVYPNPATSFVTIENAQYADVKLVALNGKTVMNGEGKNVKFNVSDLNSGVYFIQSNVNGKVNTQKLIIK